MKDMQDMHEMDEMSDMDDMKDKRSNHNMSHMKMNHGVGGHMMMDMGDLKRRFWISLILTIPIILLSPMMGMDLPFQIHFAGSNWVVLIIGTILYFYGGKPFFTGAKEELSNKKPAMMTLITMGISVAYFYSVYAVIANDLLHASPMVMDFFWELATLIDIMLIGHFVEMNSIMNAGSALDSLAKLLPNKAHKIENGKINDVKIKQLIKGDKVQVRGGEKIPADGQVSKGKTTVNESMVTGESKQISKNINDSVVGGSINGDGTFEMIITAIGKSAYLAQVQKLVYDAQTEQSKRESIADYIARLLFYAALIVGIISFIVWLILENISVAFSVVVTVLVIACPHALGLAIPLVVARSNSIAAKNGILIRNRTTMEQVKNLKYALMDKTGTLTEGNFKVRSFESLGDKSDEDILSLFASLEIDSTHPLAIGILNKTKELGIDYHQAKNVRQINGIGLSGNINGKKYDIVSPSYLDKNNIDYNKEDFKELSSKGNTLSYLLENNKLIGFVAQGDEIKNEAKYMISSLKKQNIIPVMLTGDNEGIANLVGKELAIDEVHFELLPQDKENIVKNYQSKNTKVMMIGDGVNDAPSIAKADIGIAIGSGTDIAIDSADVILVKSNPKDVIKFLNLARKTTRKMNENLVWGAGYNIIALPLAAGVLAPFGFMLSPMMGAILMSASTVIVAVNAMLLRIDK